MKVFAISDIHLDPGNRWTRDLTHLDKLVIVGDAFNVLPYGWKRWQEEDARATVRSLLSLIPKDSVFVFGNHDGRLSWLKTLVAPFPAVRQLDLEIQGRRFRFMHGHQFTYWRILAPIADEFVETLVGCSLTRKAWYDFSKSKGWMATGMPPGNPKYAAMLITAWGWAMKEALDKKTNLVMGHTHTRWFSWTQSYTVTDLGAGEEVEIK